MNAANRRGAPAAYRGYRLQALYTLGRVLSPGTSENIAFHPEGIEDLDVLQTDGHLLETIQVKSYDGLALSHLSLGRGSADRQYPFFRRAAKLLQAPNPPTVKLVNFGPIGPELRKAWAGDVSQRTRIAKKLLDTGLAQSDVDVLFKYVELVELDEAQEEAAVHLSLQGLPAGIDPVSAFDLLNFWLYRIAERRGTITRSATIDKIHHVGKFLAQRRDYHDQWFTVIKPLEDNPIADHRRIELQEEFYRGVPARYEHILAELDFYRDSKLAEVQQAFAGNQVVIIHAASGQGKTALAYRYLHDSYPETWRYSVELIEGRQHALQIANALSGYADAVQMPMAIYLDVSPRDTEWPELVKQLARRPHFHVLVTVREEDFRRANVSGLYFDYAPVELAFDEAEACRIYQRATESETKPNFLDFEEAWDRFGGAGPLMEFVYLLTQTVTLRQRLSEQVNRIREEVRHQHEGTHPDELRLLRLVSVASSYEARLDTRKLIAALRLPDPGRTLDVFEQEYLVRLSSDRYYTEGVHPIRSCILTDLLTSPDSEPWISYATQALPLIMEEDIEMFLLHSLVERPGELLPLLDGIGRFEPATWAGYAGILRVLLWSGVHNYIESNVAAIQTAREEFGPIWQQVVDLNLAGLGGTGPRDWWTTLGNLVPSEMQSRIREIRASQTPRDETFDLTRRWLADWGSAPASPTITADWAGAAELCFWGIHLGVAPQLGRWISDEDLTRAVQELPLSVLADVSLALYMGDQERHANWLTCNLSLLEERLAQEYNIVFWEDLPAAFKLHFLPSGSEASGETALDPFHNETMQRIRLIRKLFPGHEAYASHGYGHRLGGLESPFDDSTDKEGIPAAWLPPLWPVRLNAIATGLALYRFRPETWPEYVDQVLDTRRFVLTCLNQLLLGLKRYLQRNTPTNLFGGNVDAEQWDHCRTLLGGGSPLPRCAVDPWGLAHEGLDTSALPQEQTGSQAIALLRYKPYLRAWRDYTFSLAAFFQQAPHVMVTTYRAGKLPAGSPEKARALDSLHKHGVKTELANLSTDNLFEAQTKLPRYQRRFDALFGSLGGEEALPKEEVDLVGRVWQMWYYFAHRPAQMWALPQKQIPNEITIEQDQLEKGIRQEIAHLASPDLHVTVLPMESGWEDTSALWLRMDLERPTKTYTAFTELVQALRRAIGHVEFQKLGYYIAERNWPYIVIVPVVQGRMFRPFAWRLHTLSTILARKDADEAMWIYVPKPIPSENWAELGLVLWEHEDFELANRLSDAVSKLSFLAARVSDLRNIPALTEPGLRAVQMHLEKQSNAISQQLETVFDTTAAMAKRFEHLTEQDRESRPQLREAVAGLAELHKFVRPAEGFGGEQAFKIDEMYDYAARLAQARPWAEAIRLFWLEDVLDQVAAG